MRLSRNLASSPTSQELISSFFTLEPKRTLSASYSIAIGVLIDGISIEQLVGTISLPTEA